MTTIVVDRELGIMAADKMALVGGNIAEVNKITRYYSSVHGIDCAFASSGDYEKCFLFESWLRKSLDGHQDDSTYPHDGEFNCLMLCADGSLLLYLPGGQPVEIRNRYFGIGSGADAALGAIYAGASIREAVKIAGKIDSATGVGVQIVKLR